MSNISNSKKNLFKYYFRAASYMAEQDFDYKREFQPELKEFLDTVSENDFDQLFETAEKKFGNQLKIAERLFFMEKIEAMHKIMRFFFVLTIISLIVGLLSLVILSLK